MPDISSATFTEPIECDTKHEQALDAFVLIVLAQIRPSITRNLGTLCGSNIIVDGILKKSAPNFLRLLNDLVASQLSVKSPSFHQATGITKSSNQSGDHFTSNFFFLLSGCSNREHATYKQREFADADRRGCFSRFVEHRCLLSTSSTWIVSRQASVHDQNDGSYERLVEPPSLAACRGAKQAVQASWDSQPTRPADHVTTCPDADD